MGHPGAAAVRHVPREGDAAQLQGLPREPLRPALRGVRQPGEPPEAAPDAAADGRLRPGRRRVQARGPPPHARLARAAARELVRRKPALLVLLLLCVRQPVHPQPAAPHQGPLHLLLPAARGRGGRPQPPPHHLPHRARHQPRHQPAQDAVAHLPVLPLPDRARSLAPLQQRALPPPLQEPVPGVLRARAERLALDGRPAHVPPHQGAAHGGVLRRAAGVAPLLVRPRRDCAQLGAAVLLRAVRQGGVDRPQLPPRWHRGQRHPKDQPAQPARPLPAHPPRRGAPPPRHLPRGAVRNLDAAALGALDACDACHHRRHHRRPRRVRSATLAVREVARATAA
mmetsp:Transcript_1201/g.3560  ORF Transcript_1201/g.3560 Transcript_1201/m.3560 type:complete len:340 (-) Transcript_1201:453-1472(-)